MALVKLAVDDVDLMEEIIRTSPAPGRPGYDVSYVQLGRGRFGGLHHGTRPAEDPLLGTLTEITARDRKAARETLVVASRQRYGARLRIRGTSPPDRTAYYLVEQSRLLRARGVDLHPGQLIEMPPDSEMDFVTERMSMVTFTFQNAVHDAICRASDHQPSPGVLCMPAWISNRLRAAVLTYLHDYESGVHDAEVDRRVEELFAEALARSAPRRARPSAASRRRTVKAVEAFLHEHLHESVPTPVVAELADVPLRTLQQAFKVELGVSPYAYHARLRLRAARAFLRRHTPRSASVSLAAGKYGFTHLGRFSVQYREHFGETPVATLRRTPHGG